MKISHAATTTAFRQAGRLLALPILAGAMLVSLGGQPAQAQHDERRFQDEQRLDEHRDERRPPPRRARQEEYRPSYYSGYYAAPRYVYAPPPVVYTPPSALEFVFPLTFR